jgi:ribosome modulation factor
MTSPPIGPIGIAARAADEGRIAGRAGDPVTSCPYGADRPFTRRAWLKGYVAGQQDAGTPTPAELSEGADEADTRSPQA